MRKDEAADVFGNQTKMAEALGLTKGAVSQWPDKLTDRQMNEVIGAAVRMGLSDRLPRRYRPVAA